MGSIEGDSIIPSRGKPLIDFLISKNALVLLAGRGKVSFMAVIDEVKQVLGETLQLGARVDGFSAETLLFGAIAEFDSMAVVTVVTALEERFDFFVEDHEIEAEVFATIGSLAAFVSQKLDA